MRSNSKITASLNKKIAENERKMRDILIINEFNSIPIAYYNKNKPMNKSNRKHHKIKSQEDIKISKSKQLKLQFSTRSNDKSNNNSGKKSEKNNNKLLSYSKNLFTNEKLRKNNNSFICSSKKKEEEFFSPTKKINQKELDTIINRLYSNSYKKRKKSEIENENKNKSAMSKKSKINFSDIYSRFKEDIKKRNENLEKKREEINNNNKTIYTYKPRLNLKKDKENKNKEDFLERQKKYFEEKKLKDKKYKEDLIKSENENINKSNILSKKSAKNKKEIDKMINEFIDWDKKRKEKLEKQKKEIETQIDNEFDYIPKINKNSSFLAQKNKDKEINMDIFTRLSGEDKVLKAKQNILTQLYTPTFRPKLSAKKKKGNKNSSKRKEFETMTKRLKFDDNLENEYNGKIFDKFNEEEYAEYGMEFDDLGDGINEENIKNAFRKTLFHKNKK